MSVEVLHEWSKPTPDFVTEAVNRYGTNRFGEPLFRVVWSETQTHRVWKRNEAGRLVEHTLLTYPDVQRWVLETWVPPEKYGHPVLWDKQNRDSNLSLGPFPSRGQYEHSYTLEVNGQYLPLSLDVLRLTCRLIEQSRQYSFKQKHDALQAKKDKKEKARDNRVRDIITDALGPFNGQPTSGALFRSTRDGSDIKIDKTTKALPKSMQTNRGFFQV